MLNPDFRSVAITLEYQIDSEAAFYSLVLGLMLSYTHSHNKFGHNSFACLEAYSLLMQLKESHPNECKLILQEICNDNPNFIIPDFFLPMTAINRLNIKDYESGDGQSSDMNNY